MASIRILDNNLSSANNEILISSNATVPGTLLVNSNIYANTVTINNNNSASNLTTGSLVVTGGLNVNGVATMNTINTLLVTGLATPLLSSDLVNKSYVDSHNTLAILPGGANLTVLYNNSGVFAGSTNFTYDGTFVVIRTDLNISSLTSNTLVATSGTIGGLNASNFSSTSLVVGSASVSIASINSLYIGQISNSLGSLVVNNFYGTNLIGSNILATNGTINTLLNTNEIINSLSGSVASLVNASIGATLSNDLTVNSLVVSLSSINSLTTLSMNILNGTFTNLSINSAIITNSTISSLVASLLLIPGASGAKYIATGVLGNLAFGIAISSDNSTLVLGSINGTSTVVYANTNNTWILYTYLIPVGLSTAALSQQSVAISLDGSTIAMSTYNETSVFVFVKTGTSYSQLGSKFSGQVTSLLVSWFGYDVQLSSDGNTLAVSDPGLLYVGYPNVNGQGGTFIFTRTNSVWSQVGTPLVGTNVTSYYESLGVIALSNDGKLLAETVYYSGLPTFWTWVLTNSAWTQTHKLITSDQVTGNVYNCSIAISSDNSMIALGSPSDNNFIGATWVFANTSNTWIQQGTKLIGTNYVGTSLLGSSVTFAGSKLISGAQGDTYGIGAFWTYVTTNNTWSQYGTKIVPNGYTGLSNFGAFISANSTNIAVGAPTDASNNLGAFWIYSSNVFGPIVSITDSTIATLSADLYIGTNLNVVASSVSSLTLSSFSTLNLSLSSGTINNLIAITSSVGSLQFQNITSALLTVTTGSVTNMTVTNGSYNSIVVSGTGASIGTLIANNATIGSYTSVDINVSIATIGQLNTTLSTVNNLNTTSGTITNLQATNINAFIGSIGSIISTSMAGNNTIVSSGTVTSLIATNALVTSMSVPMYNATTETVTNLTATSATIETLGISTINLSSGTVGILNTTTGSISLLNVTDQTMSNSVVSSGTITNLNASSATASSLVVSTGSIASLSFTNSTVTNLNVSISSASSLFASTGSINNLISTGSTITNLSTTLLFTSNTSGNTIIGTTANILVSSILNLIAPLATIGNMITQNGSVSSLVTVMLSIPNGGAGVKYISGSTSLVTGITNMSTSNLTTTNLNASSETVASMYTSSLTVTNFISANDGINANPLMVYNGTTILVTGMSGASPNFGYSSAISADNSTVVVGSPGDNNNIGATYVFINTNNQWSQLIKLIGSGSSAPSQNGLSICINSDGSTYASGAIADNASTGAVFVFVRTNNTYTLLGPKLVGTVASANIGQSVSLSSDGNILAIGQYFYPTIYIYTRTNSVWSLNSYFFSSYLYFGYSLSFSADASTLAVGTLGASNAGGCLMYIRTGTSWISSLLLFPNDASGASLFGQTVSLSSNGTLLAIGGATDNNNVGATWIFTFTGSSWYLSLSKIVASGYTSAAFLGSTLSLYNNELLIGASGNLTWLFYNNNNYFALYGSVIVLNLNSCSLNGNSISITNYSGQFIAYNTYIIDTNMTMYGLMTTTLLNVSSAGFVNGLLTTTGFSSNNAYINLMTISSTLTLSTGPVYLGSLNNNVLINANPTSTLVGTKYVTAGLTGLSQAYSVAISSDNTTLVEGVRKGTQNFVYINTNNTWLQYATLIPTGISIITNAPFVTSVAISSDGTTIVLGSPNDVSNNGFLGSVYVFVRTNNTYILLGSKLSSTAPGMIGGQLGITVSLSSDGNTIAAGDDSIIYSGYPGISLGATIVFVRSSNSTWNQFGSPLVGTTNNPNSSIISFTTIISNDASLITYNNIGDPIFWIFVKTNNLWTASLTLIPYDGGSGMSGSFNDIAISSDNKMIVYGGESDAGRSDNYPVAWTFINTNNTWVQQGPRITATGFGTFYNVALSNSYLFAANYIYNSTGALQIFYNNNNQWFQYGQPIIPSDILTGAQFGFSLSANTSNILVGAPFGGATTGAFYIYPYAFPLVNLNSSDTNSSFSITNTIINTLSSLQVTGGVDVYGGFSLLSGALNGSINNLYQYLLQNNSGPQTILANTFTPVLFSSVNTNTFGTNLTYSNDTNGKFTNTSGTQMILNVSYTVSFHSINISGTVLNAYLRVNSTGNIYAQFQKANRSGTGVQLTNVAGSGQSTLKLSNNDYLLVYAKALTNMTIGALSPSEMNVISIQQSLGLSTYYQPSSISTFTNYMAINETVGSLALNNIITLGSTGFLNSNPVYMRGYSGSYNPNYYLSYSNSFQGQTSFDGPLIVGNSGGVLGTTANGGQNTITWDSTGGISLIGALAVNGTLYVNGGSTITTSYAFISSTGSIGNATNAKLYSIMAALRMIATEFDCISSEKIKNTSDYTINEIISIMKELALYKYDYKDKKYSTGIHYGLIAEELECNEITRHYVSREMKQWIPNIMTYGLIYDDHIVLNEDVIDTTEDLSLILCINQDESSFVIKQCTLGKTITFKECSENIETGTKVFVYGTYEVIPTINKNSLFEINLCLSLYLLEKVEELNKLLKELNNN